MIKFMVDSASDRRPSDPNIDYFIPITVSIDSKEYRSGVDLDSDAFYGLLQQAEEFPRTSQPSPQEFLDIFQQVRDSGDSLIYFSLSSALSGTYQGACIAREMAECDRIHIIDTKTASHLIGVLLDYAAGLREEGLSAREIAEKCEALKSRVKVVAGVDTLEYLYKGGRLSRASAAVGEIAGIKPIVTVKEDGSVTTAGKCLGRGRAMQFLVDRVSALTPDPDFPVYTLYTCGQENVEKLEQKLSQSGIPVARRLQIGPTIGAHVGPGVYGILFVCE